MLSASWAATGEAIHPADYSARHRLVDGLAIVMRTGIVGRLRESQRYGAKSARLGAGGNGERRRLGAVPSRDVEDCPTWTRKNGTSHISNLNIQHCARCSASAGSTPVICAASATQRPAST
ncbi:MAG: hypothetical protein R3C97_00565 [Geminicoccaceae bacterium]